MCRLFKMYVIELDTKYSCVTNVTLFKCFKRLHCITQGKIIILLLFTHYCYKKTVMNTESEDPLAV